MALETNPAPLTATHPASQQPPSKSSPLMLRWREVRILGHFIAPTGFHIVAALLPGIIYLLVDQGAEILSMMGEAMLPGPGFRPMAPALFLLGSVIVGLTIWWSARVMLEFAWEPPVATSRPGGFAQVRAFLQKHWPRILGVLPVLLVAAACFVRVTHYHNAGSTGASRAVAVLGVAHLVAACVLAAFFRHRRRRLARASEPQFSSLRHLFRESVSSRNAQFALLALSCVTLLGLWAAPQFVAPHLGTGFMLALALIAWVTIGTLFAIFSARTRFPVFLALLLWTLLNSIWMDNHAVRLSQEERPLDKLPTVPEAFQAWQQTHPAVPGARQRPLFLVATEGGGIRAAYWTATVLASLEQESRVQREEGQTVRSPFAESCFAISGVSGGSVGAAVFDALLADSRPNLLEEAQQVLGWDHLAPLMGALLFPDAVQRAIPVVLPGTDRGAVLERSWERAYRQTTGLNRLAEPFHDLWRDNRHPFLPHLLLNSTSVNSGQRVIFSDLAISAPAGQEGFFDAVDMREVIYKKSNGTVQPWDIPLSSAAHCSARFTYTNPAGLLSSQERVADGGYFENTGAATLREVLASLRDHADATVQPVVIIISNDPQREPEGTLAKWQKPEQTELQQRLAGPAAPAPAAAPSYSQEFHSTEPQQFCSEVLSPVRALMHTREARGSLALKTLYHEIGASPDPKRPFIIHFQLIDHGIPLPLGWSLSNQAARDMQGQVWRDANNEAISQVMSWLETPAPLKN